MSSNEKNQDFLREMASVAPLKQDKILSTGTNEPSVNASYRQKVAENFVRQEQNFLTDGEVSPVGPEEILSFKLEGVQPGVFKKLRQGRYEFDFHLDLHRKTVAEARNEVYRLLSIAFKKGFRTLLLTHGKGIQSNPPARLKSYLYHWLKQVDSVIAFHSAVPKDGGAGSIYVLLKKNPALSRIDKEKYD